MFVLKKQFIVDGIANDEVQTAELLATVRSLLLNDRSGVAARSGSGGSVGGNQSSPSKDLSSSSSSVPSALAIAQMTEKELVEMLQNRDQKVQIASGNEFERRLRAYVPCNNFLSLALFTLTTASM
jgi:hypothetical protein